MVASSAIQLDNVSKTYISRHNQVTAIRAVSFHVKPGEFVALVGPSGCGKSTVLSLIAGLLHPDEGELRLFGEMIKGPSLRTGYMLQHDGLLEWRTVAENIALGLEIRREISERRLKQARALLHELGLGHANQYYPSQLSGGMRQRVALVRTLALEPDILLLDEPFSAIDYQNKLFMEGLLSTILQRKQMTAVLVTHDLEEALAMSDRVLILGGQPGAIQRIIQLPEEIRALEPLKARGHPLFRPLFHELWQEIQQPHSFHQEGER